LDGLRAALEFLIGAAEPAMDCYYGGLEAGCDHRPMVTKAIEQARAALATSTEEPADDR
jgi:hypothetical protein